MHFVIVHYFPTVANEPDVLYIHRKLILEETYHKKKNKNNESKTYKHGSKCVSLTHKVYNSVWVHESQIFFGLFLLDNMWLNV